jgi:hypothetical protein
MGTAHGNQKQPMNFGLGLKIYMVEKNTEMFYLSSLKNSNIFLKIQKNNHWIALAHRFIWVLIRSYQRSFGEVRKEQELRKLRCKSCGADCPNTCLAAKCHFNFISPIRFL